MAEKIRPKILERLSPVQRAVVDGFTKKPLDDLPESDHDYVLEFAFQLTQMCADPQWFVEDNAIEEPELAEMIMALEALCRPALVVDGQHRLVGASESDVEVVLPVVALPNSNWMEQIYQFIVINEKAQKVETSLLTDIFGSSLTRIEQKNIRDRLARAKVDVEARIAAVVADRDPSSPFFQMIKLKLSTDSPSAARTNAYITDMTVRLLIDGTSRHSRGWRVDSEFFNLLVEPNFPVRSEWESWTEGRWREYWFCFWQTVRDFYNEGSSGISVGC